MTTERLPIAVTCPACDRRKVTETTCPQCGADLGPLLRIAAFPLECLEEGQTQLQARNYERALTHLGVAATLAPELEAARSAIQTASEQAAEASPVLRKGLENNRQLRVRLKWLAPAAFVVGFAIMFGIHMNVPKPKPEIVTLIKEIPAPKPPEPPAAKYRVRPNDSWWKIAATAYGTPLVWQKIEERNRERFQQRGGLFPGDEIELPSITFGPQVR